MTKTSKKNFEQTKKSTKRIAKLINKAKEKFDQKRRKRNLFLS
jgi:hypothetical protein